MNIGIDVDGVLADANAATLPLVERYTGTHIEKDEITHWDYVSDTTGLSVWHFVRLMGQAWQDFENMPIEEPTVANSLTQLMRRGHHVSIVTQRTRESFPFVCLCSQCVSCVTGLFFSSFFVLFVFVSLFLIVFC